MAYATPMSNLRNTLEGLASDFAANVIAALRNASLEDISSVTQGSAVRRGRGRPAGQPAAPAGSRARRGKGGRLARRSVEEIGKMVDAISDVLAKHPDGMRAEQIRDALGCDTKELPRPLADALKAGRVTKTGQKRATTYFASSGGGARRRTRGNKK
jgi:hypothetical protein